MASLALSRSAAGSNPAAVAFPATNRRSVTSRAVNFRVFASSTSSSSKTEPDLSVNVNGLHMPNPFVIGSGPPGTNYTVMKKAFDEGWGAVIAKTVINHFFFFHFISILLC